MECTRSRTAAVYLMFGILIGLLNGSARAAAQMSAPAAGDHRASVAPSLALELAALGDQDTIRVVLVMKEQAPIEELSRQLRAEGASQRKRHERVVRALQSAAASQGELLSELARGRIAGTVKSYQGYWVANFVEVTAIREYLLGLLERSDIASMQPIVRAEPLDEEEMIPAHSRSADDRPDRGAACGLITINADKVWQMGINGTGTIVAHIDTGVQGTHPALASRWRGAQGHPASECWKDMYDSLSVFPYDTDPHGHGTGTMGIMVGLGGPQDTIGVAWGASWIAGIPTNFCLELFQWLIDPDLDPGTSDDRPDVVNCSFSMGQGFCREPWFPFSVFDNVQAAGTAIIWANGNCSDGQGHWVCCRWNSVAWRAVSLTNSFSVGNADCDPCGYPCVPYFGSCYGPTACDDPPPGYEFKPEVAAPGTEIYTATTNGGYIFSTGTSEAAPHVAGVIALMRQANPEIDVDTMLEILMQSATDISPAGEDNASGWGLIDAEQAVLLAQRHITVRPDGTGQYPTIQAAINAAQDGWTIHLANGSFSSSGNDDIDFLGKAIVVRSLGGPDFCVISAARPQVSGFVFTHQEGHGSVLEGVTMVGFAGRDSGHPLNGAISIHASSPTIRNCVFRHNFNAVNTDGGVAAIFENCTFTDNYDDSMGWGSAAHFEETDCEMRDCVIESNRSGPGPVSPSIVSQYGTLRLTRCRFRENGGIYTGWSGGAIEVYGNLIATDCVFEENLAYAGGAIGWYSDPGTALTLTRCTFDHNSCVAGGSAIAAWGNSGGGVASLDNCILSFGSPAVAAFVCANMASPPSLICCDVFGNGTDYTPGCLSGAWNANGNFSLDPLYCPEGLTLQPNSPCAVENSSCGQVGALPAGCLIQLGSCCISEESCEVTLESQCTHPWLRGVTCSPNPCPGAWSAVGDGPTADQAGITAIVPNPASGTAQICYETAGGGEYRLEVFNSAGQFVRRLASGRLGIGAHDVGWDARDETRDRVPAGMYFVRLTQGRQRSASRLVVVR